MISIDVIRQRNLRNKKMKSWWPANIWTLTMFDVKAKNCSKLRWKRNRKYVILYWNIRFLGVIDVCFGKYLTNNKVVVLPLQATLKLFVSILNEWYSFFCLIQSLRVMLMESAERMTHYPTFNLTIRFKHSFNLFPSILNQAQSNYFLFRIIPIPRT